MPDSKPMQYRIVDRSARADGSERAEVVAGLLAAPARIAPKYFYDELGCALYGAICRLPEYYPTRTEIEVFRDHRTGIAAAVGQASQLVDLGAGDCCKAQSWLPFLNPSRYIAVDIAAAEIERSLARMAPDHPGIEMLGVVADFNHDLPLGDLLDARPVTFFYPGSSIGNFTPSESIAFLRRIRALCVTGTSGLLIGVDGKKPKAVLDAAYDDALGVTAAFNRNVLTHLNRRFGFDFEIGSYAHLGFYNEALGRIEMHLEARREQVVSLGGGVQRRFARGERIHTENSYKYAPEEFERLLGEAGFTRMQRWGSAQTPYFVFYAS